MVALLLQLSRAHAGCDEAPLPEDFAALVQRAARDPVAARAARALVPCIDLPMEPIDAAQFHRAMAMDAWTRRADAEALAEMRAARAAASGWRAPARFLPLWAAAEPDPAAPSLPWEGLVDGGPGPIYLDRAAIVQRFTEGEWETRYLLPMTGSGDVIPDPPDSPMRLKAPAAVSARARLPAAGLVTGIALGVTGVIAFGYSVAWTAEFKDLDNPRVKDQDDLAELGNRANLATVGAWVLTGAGATCIGASVINLEFR